jgi:hypothetical protein
MSDPINVTVVEAQEVVFNVSVSRAEGLTEAQDTKLTGLPNPSVLRVTAPVVEATNWTVSDIGMYLWGPFMMLSFVAQRINIPYDAATWGNTSNETMFTMPVEARGTLDEQWQSMTTHINGVSITTAASVNTGEVRITTAVPGVEISIGQTISGAGLLLLYK